MKRDYWEQKYRGADLKWDIGTVSMPLKAYIDQLPDKNIKILVPGAGRGHEVVYLHQNGFRNVFVADIAKAPLDHLGTVLPNFPKDRLLLGDFFLLKEQDFDLILEQTFFCAILPLKRKDYVAKMDGILKNGGKLVGLLFNFELTAEGPPFGGSILEYRSLFSLYFHLKVLEPAHNSIKPRKDRELFFIFEKRSDLGKSKSPFDTE
ncbi:MAG: methyltransferase domain-containing protein [Sediminicola sp.]|tara:strand:+ start:16386 stop:17003 length:618 start_codon:yes stop_codon:yes gene_type:complete